MSDADEIDWSGVTFPVTTASLFDRPIRETLLDLAEHVGPDERPDRYGAGEVIESFEAHVADLLGKPTALFAPSGTMLQQIALRIWSERTGRPGVAMHPTSHLEQHEFRAHEVLHGLRSVRVGPRDEPLTLDALQEVREPYGTLLLELPQREVGYVLPTWDQLQALVEEARDQEAVLHLDGARLWEAAPFYGPELGTVDEALPRIAELFDTVYVSLYKIVGGIAGAVLAGPEDVIDEARVWRRRHGGELIHLWPLVVSARAGLDRVLPRVDAYHERAVELAAALADVDGVDPYPAPPHTNAFRLYLHGGVDAWTEAHRAVAHETGLGLSKRFWPTPVPSVALVEIVISEASFDVGIPDVVAMIRACVARLG